jgi:hypothetical protein
MDSAIPLVLEISENQNRICSSKLKQKKTFSFTEKFVFLFYYN